MTQAPRSTIALLVCAALALGALLLDAARLRRVRDGDAVAATRLLGLSDLALSSSARWLRHPTQAEPAAANADQPFPFDVEPAGGVLPPPRALHDAIERGAEVRRR